MYVLLGVKFKCVRCMVEKFTAHAGSSPTGLLLRLLVYWKLEAHAGGYLRGSLSVMGNFYWVFIGF